MTTLPTDSGTNPTEIRPLMSRLTFGRLTEAWRGEAADFTPLLAQQVDALGEAIGLDLTSIGQSEVATAGGRRIDIVARDDAGAEIVIENQYGRGDHDHLTRGLAYAVARRARALVVVAEEHRDEFRAVAQYLNELAEHDSERGVAVWLVEAKAVRIDASPWAPLFTAVVEPNAFTASVETARQEQVDVLGSLDEFFDRIAESETQQAAREVVKQWMAAGYRRRLGPNHVVLEAPGPAVAGIRTVVAIFDDGHVMVPFASYGGSNTGLPIDDLTDATFRRDADQLFGFAGTEKRARTAKGWLTAARVQPLLDFCFKVADSYSRALTTVETNPTA